MKSQNLSKYKRKDSTSLKIRGVKVYVQRSGLGDVAEFGKRQADKRKPIKDITVWYMLVLLIEKRRPETTAQR